MGRFFVSTYAFNSLDIIHHVAFGKFCTFDNVNEKANNRSVYNKNSFDPVALLKGSWRPQGCPTPDFEDPWYRKSTVFTPPPKEQIWHFFPLVFLE